MLPLIQAEEIKNAATEYLKATYTFEDKELDFAFENFLLNKHSGMFKGPYMQIRLPFLKADKPEQKHELSQILQIKPAFEPYLHQFEAFKRLSTRNEHKAEPLILTTGTGSGKTESFLFPLLDYCYQHRDKPGIKAIILYPMNALATDQARRIAEEIHDFTDENGNPVLRGVIRAGLFIGVGKGGGKTRSTRMEESQIIEDRETIVKSPPDILLTNFKMLDFALLQAQYHSLWKHNFTNKELLKFLVLDELHTYDGAKGSDVANLVRRLKLKLDLPIHQIIPIGTSATLAGGEEGKKELIKFFSQIFGVNLTTEAIIDEKRILPEDFFKLEMKNPTINISKISDCEFKETDDYKSYINRQLEFWNYSNLKPEELGKELLLNEWLYELLYITQSSVHDISTVNKKWLNTIELSSVFNAKNDLFLLGSLLSIIVFAKEKSGSKFFPFLYVQATYWLRSLNRIVRKLQATPVFEWESDMDPNEPTKALPPYFCRECGGSGWLALKKESSSIIEDNFASIRSQFMATRGNKNIYFLSHLHEKTSSEILASDFSPTANSIEGFLHPHFYNIEDKKESSEHFKILGVRSLNGDRIDKICPHCNSKNSLSMIGTGIPTLESIAAAQVLASASDPSKDNERKLLVFTNGVQDAAHQAGFIENRNYRFGMRHAIQTVLNHYSETIPLNELYLKFESFWKGKLSSTAKNDIDAYYHKFLPPDCSARMDIEDYRNSSGSIKSNFEKEFSNRISWEIWAEYSYRAVIGRTLEKSSASAVCFNKEEMEDVFDQMKYWLDQNKLGNGIEKSTFLRFLNGFLHRLRTKGGVNHKYLKKYRTERTNYYLITQNVNKKYFLMQNFGKNTRLPKFIALASGYITSAFDIVQMNKKMNWFATYFLKSFPLVERQEIELINEFYAQLLEYLDSNNLLDKKVASGISNYGLPENSILISKKVADFVCTECGHKVHSAEEGADLMTGMKCLQYRCTGNYLPSENKGQNYYRQVYNRGKAIRIFANDHTGLIKRERREEIEYDFKKQPNYKSTNVLVATSTLEMGIDIGDLNVSFNSSLPPETSNYLQRIGRAGRASGTSLILNLAGRSAHDLYFFHEPMKMMGGEIKTPACYLDAKDILRRHFMAFCFDSWASENPGQNRIPGQIKQLKIKSIKVGDNRFLFNYISEYINKNKTTLFNRFSIHYKESFGAEVKSIALIKEELFSERLTISLRKLHEHLVSEVNYYSKKQFDIKKQLVKLPKTSPETEILKNERNALSAAIRNIYNRNVIEHLTNIGILPNYAFPETGVSLNAQIRRKKEVNGKIEFKYKEFGEIVRPSSSAITELAPSNIFYSQGQKLESQGLEIKSSDDYEEYRFCSNCDHLELDVNVLPENRNACPVCGHDLWSSISNKRTLVKLQAVTSTNDKEKSRITDSSDERERKMFHKSIHLKIDHSSSEGAFVLKRVPFGIELFHSVEYIEINTGVNNQEFFGNREIEINGKNQPEVGYVVCKTCGKSTERILSDRELEKRQRSYHFPYCSNRKEDYKGKKDDFFEEIYLYRRLNTEALLILLPVQDFMSEEKVTLFKAGLQLGLRNYFKGKPDHINIRETEAFNKESRQKEKYLVFYETIPGGTGYLSELFNTDNFTKILEIAYDRISQCTCKDEEKDGCYSCIYTYGNQYDRAVLSRSLAEDLFEKIITKAYEWNRVNSLQNVNGFANNEESELELKFVDALSKISTNLAVSSFKPDNEKGIKIYKLELEVKNSQITYEIWPQNLAVNLSGITLKTRPDFLIKCVSVIENEKAWTFEQLESIKPIAIYLDGYQYHASELHPRFSSDIEIRNSITNSEKYYHWTLSWDDFKANLYSDLDFIGEKVLSYEKNFKKLAKHLILKTIDLSNLHSENNLTRLIFLLKSPLLQTNLQTWSAAVLFHFQEKWVEKTFSQSDVELALTQKNINIISKSKTNKTSYIQLDSFNLLEEAKIEAFIGLAKFDIQAFSFYKKEKEWDKENWERFWKIYNLTQFHELNSINIDASEELEPTRDEHQEILDNFDEVLHSFVLQLIENNIEFNKKLDFDLMNEGAIIASAALGSKTKKFVVNPFDKEAEAIFRNNGYKILESNKLTITNIL